MEDPEYGAPTSETTTQRQNAPKRQVKNISVNQGIPMDILKNEALNKAIATLPSNYSFEIHKTLWRMRKSAATRVALQFPEGLLMYSCIISDILQTFGNCETIIMGDVTYGACCIDDLSAIALGCDFMVHYGHSCLVPIDVCQIPTLYVFVDISFNSDHLIMMLLKHFDAKNTHLILAGTIQFSSTIQNVYKIIKNSFLSVTVPQAKPLSQGEVLGCTAPKLLVQKTTTSAVGANTIKIHVNNIEESLEDTCGHGATPEGIPLSELYPKKQQCCGENKTGTCEKSSPSSCCGNDSILPSEHGQFDDMYLPSLSTTESEITPNLVCVFLADGRFHLESLMIQNPHIPRYLRYDPYNRMMTEESYDYSTMHERRYASIQKAKKCTKWGVVLGTLGRQGSTHILSRIEQALIKNGLQYTPILLSELFPTKLTLMSSQCEAWVQIACPRLSVDWASGFEQPLLSTYEFFVAMRELEQERASKPVEGVADTTTADVNKTEWLPGGVYPMDYYSSQGGEWTNYYHRQPAVIAAQQAQNPLPEANNALTTEKKMTGKDALAMIRAKNASKKAALAQQAQGNLAETHCAPAVQQAPVVKAQADDMD